MPRAGHVCCRPERPFLQAGKEADFRLPKLHKSRIIASWGVIVKLSTILCVMGIAPAILGAADAPYVGKWKLNPAKSQLTGETFSIEKTSNGMLRFAQGDLSYTFNLDGKEYTTYSGRTASWKQLDPNNWEVTLRINDTAQAAIKETVKGDILSMAVTIHKPDGGTVDQPSVWTRVSGGPGLLGKWKSSQVKAAATVFEIASSGADGVTINDPTSGLVCKGKFDGKDYPCTGAKYMVSFKSIGPRSFEMTTKSEGKPVYLDTFTVSADGKILSDDGTPITVKELVKAVYDRQ
jgi:hypothetical protein